MIPSGRSEFIKGTDAPAPALRIAPSCQRTGRMHLPRCLVSRPLASASRQRMGRMRLAPCLVPPAVPRSIRSYRPWATSSSAQALSSAWMSLYCGAASRWAHVATICFMCLWCMLHMFPLNVSKVDLLIYMLWWLYTYVTSVGFKCFSYFKRMLQGFYLDVAYVAMAIHVCCKCIFQMFQLFFGSTLQVYVSNVSVISDICCKYFIWMSHMLRCLHICCKRMF